VAKCHDGGQRLAEWIVLGRLWFSWQWKGCTHHKREKFDVLKFFTAAIGRARAPSLADLVRQALAEGGNRTRRQCEALSTGGKPPPVSQGEIAMTGLRIG